MAESEIKKSVKKFGSFVKARCHSSWGRATCLSPQWLPFEEDHVNKTKRIQIEFWA